MATERDDACREVSQRLHDAVLPRSEQRRFEGLRSDARGALQLAVHLALCGVGLAMWLSNRTAAPFGVHSLLGFGGLLLQSTTMAFLFTGLHETVHRTAFRTRSLNVVVGHFLGAVTLRPARHYMYYHFNHHKYTGDPSRDPELQDTLIDLRLDNPGSYLLYLTGLPFWFDRLTTLLRHGTVGWVLPREELFLTPRTKHLMLQEARVYVVCLCIASAACLLSAAAMEVLWWGWGFPNLVAQPFLRFYLVAEHTGCAAGDSMLSNTRTTHTYAWYRFLAWNMPYHAEHHAFPQVPFGQLPALHAAIKDRLPTEGGCHPTGEHGYLGVHLAILRSFVAKGAT